MKGRQEEDRKFTCKKKDMLECTELKKGQKATLMMQLRVAAETHAMVHRDQSNWLRRMREKLEEGGGNIALIQAPKNEQGLGEGFNQAEEDDLLNPAT